MFIISRLIVFLLAIYRVSANTETYSFHVPTDFPIEKSEHNLSIPYIDLSSTTFNSTTFNVHSQSIFFLDLLGLQNSESYNVRICWSAIDPIEIKSIKHQIIPYNTEFNGVYNIQPRIVLEVEIESFSYPEVEIMVPIDVNISLLKLGIPVDLYSVVIFLLMVFSCSILLLKTTFRSQLLKDFEKKNS